MKPKIDRSLSLGPANENDVALVELRAAELALNATNSTPPIEHARSCTGGLTGCAYCGWLDAETGVTGPDRIEDPEGAAGYLAYFIMNHDHLLKQADLDAERQRQFDDAERNSEDEIEDEADEANAP